MTTLHFKVAGLCFDIVTPSPGCVKRLLPSYAPFFLPSPVEDVPILTAYVSGQAVDSDPQGDEIGQFDCGGTNHGVYRTGDGYKFIISNLSGQVACAMLANADFSRCTITAFGDESNCSFGLGNAMMIAFAFAASHYQTLLMHSSVAISNGRGYLFLGKSGTGKSTHSSLWRKHIPGSELLNDDNPALRVGDDGSVFVYGTPWSGKTPCYRNLQMPAGAIVRLEQAPQNSIRRESKLHAFASILSSCSTMIWDKPSYDDITKTVSKVAEIVPTFYLKCLPDEEAACICHAAITQA